MPRDLRWVEPETKDGVLTWKNESKRTDATLTADAAAKLLESAPPDVCATFNDDAQEIITWQAML